jgi:hypothetical protein
MKAPVTSETVADIHTDAQLIFRWLASMTLVKPEKGRWTRAAVVKDMFAVGSTSAGQICRRHGFDPDEMVKR